MAWDHRSLLQVGTAASRRRLLELDCCDATLLPARFSDTGGSPPGMVDSGVEDPVPVSRRSHVASAGMVRGVPWNFYSFFPLRPGILRVIY